MLLIGKREGGSMWVYEMEINHSNQLLPYQLNNLTASVIRAFPF